MIAVDTNVVVRVIVDDDQMQVRKARAVLARGDILINSGVLIETEWVLRDTYELSREVVATSLEGLLGLEGVNSPWPEHVLTMLGAYRSGMDFADVVHLIDAEIGGCTEFVTFDAALRKRAPQSGFEPKTMAP